MEKGVLIQILYLLVYDALITAVCAINNIDGRLNFYGVIVENKPVFKFTCESFQRPVGDAMSFQVDLITVDVIRNSNNKCYDRYKECKADTCLCYFDGVTFKMEYWYEVLNISESFTFGVEMILKDKHANFVVVTLSRFYNGKDFENLKIVIETNQYKFMDNTVKLVNDLESGASKEWILNVVFASVAFSLMMVVSVLCIHRYYKRTGVDEPKELKPCISDTNEAADEDSKSVCDFLAADYEPLEDKSFAFIAVNTSFSKRMPYSNNDEDTGHSFVTGRTVSEGQIKIKSGMKPPPSVRECPKGISIQASVQEKEGANQSGSVSFHQIDKDYDTEEVSSDFEEMESDHPFEFLDKDNISEDDKSEYRNTAGSIPFKDIESEGDSSDFEEIDFEETVITGLIDTLTSEHDESDGMQPCNTSTSEQSMSKESAHVDRDYAINLINILKIDDEPLVFRQLNKSLGNRMQYSDTIEEADQSVGGRRAHSNGKIEIGPPPDFCEDYQVETLQISVYDGKGFHLSCSYEWFEDDDGDPFSDSELQKIVEKDFQCYQGLVPFEDTVIEDACYNFVEIETEDTPSLTKNHENKEKALLVIGATEIGNSRFVRSLENLLMRGSYSKDCQSTIICKTANERQLEFTTTANTVNGAPTINFIVNAISILGSMETHDTAILYNTLKDFDKRIELLLHSTICRSFRYHICSCVNRQDSKLGDDVLQHFFLNLKHRKPNLMLQHG